MLVLGTIRYVLLQELVSFIQKQDSHQKQLLVAQQKTGVEKTFKPRQGVDTARQVGVTSRSRHTGAMKKYS